MKINARRRAGLSFSWFLDTGEEGAILYTIPMTRTTIDEFFAGFEDSRPIFDALQAALDAIGPSELRVTKSQVSFWRRKAVARAWIPARYLKCKTAPLVLTLGFSQRDNSPRWKEIVEPTPGKFTHHLELYSAREIDDQVCELLKKAWELADPGGKD